MSKEYRYSHVFEISDETNDEKYNQKYLIYKKMEKIYECVLLPLMLVSLVIAMIGYLFMNIEIVRNLCISFCLISIFSLIVFGIIFVFQMHKYNDISFKLKKYLEDYKPTLLLKDGSYILMLENENKETKKIDLFSFKIEEHNNSNILIDVCNSKILIPKKL